MPSCDLTSLALGTVPPYVRWGRYLKIADGNRLFRRVLPIFVPGVGKWFGRRPILILFHADRNGHYWGDISLACPRLRHRRTLVLRAHRSSLLDATTVVEIRE